MKMKKSDNIPLIISSNNDIMYFLNGRPNGCSELWVRQLHWCRNKFQALRVSHSNVELFITGWRSCLWLGTYACVKQNDAKDFILHNHHDPMVMFSLEFYYIFYIDHHQYAVPAVGLYPVKIPGIQWGETDRGMNIKMTEAKWNKNKLRSS